MKLILKHSWYEPYVASGTYIHPFEYSSKEDAFVDFTTLMESADYEFEFLGVDPQKNGNHTKRISRLIVELGYYQ